MGFDLEALNKTAPVQKKSKKSIYDYFKPAAENDRIKGLNLGLQGKAKAGKTDFLQSCPPPVFIADLEIGAQLVYNNRYSAKSKPPYKPIFPDEILHESGGKNVCILECVVLNSKDDIEYDASIGLLFEALDAFAEIDRGTIGVDSATLFWKWEELKWKMIKPSTEGDKPGSKFKYRFDWGPPTEEYYRLIMKLMAKKDVHFVICGHEKSMYDGKGNAIDGLFEGKWQPQTPHWMDIVLRLFKEYHTGEKGELKPHYGAKIIESRYARAVDNILPEVSYQGLKKLMKEQFEVEILDYPGEE